MRVVCCNLCFDDIARENPTSARIWIDLCASYAAHGVLSLREYRVPQAVNEMRFLETKGYINTMDGEEYISIRVNGHEIGCVEEEQELFQTFCINREEHDTEI